MLRSKTRLALVYRSLARGIFGRNVTSITENILHSSAGNMTHIHLSFGLLTKETRVGSAEKGGMGRRATEPGYSSYHPVSSESRLRAARSMMTLATIPDFVMHRDTSRPVSTASENKRTQASDVRAPVLLPAQRAKESYLDAKPAITSRSSSQILRKTHKRPQRVIIDAKSAFARTSAAKVLHRTQENPEDIITDTKPAFAPISAAQVLHRKKGTPGQIITNMQQFVALRSVAQMLHRTQESSPRIIGDTKSAIALTSIAQAQYRGLDGLPLVTRQIPKINVSDLPSGEDYPTVAHWVYQRNSAHETMEAQPPSALMAYAIPPGPPVERESKKEVVMKKEEPKPPAINISTLSERVYSMIESRLKIDRERRGVCG